MPEGREEVIHKAIVSWLRLVLPEAIVHHSPNAVRWNGKAAKINGAKNIALGTIKGFPDVWGYCDLGEFFLEVKAEGGRLSEAQREFRDRYIRLGGHRYAVVRSIEDVREALDSWGITTRETRE